MQMVFDVAIYIFLAVFLFGTVLVGIILKIWLFRTPSLPPLPHAKDLPNLALRKFKKTLEDDKRKAYQTTGINRERLKMEVSRLESRLDKLEKQNFQDQEPYYQALTQRENSWKKWYQLHQQLVVRKKKMTGQERKLLVQAERSYKGYNNMVEEEWHAAAARDGLSLQELEKQNVLTSMEKTPDHLPDIPSDSPPGESPINGNTDSPGPVQELHQADFGLPEANLTGKKYLDPAFDLSFTTEGVLKNADLSRCLFPGTDFTGLHLYLDCLFRETEFTRIKISRQEKPHQFVGCDFNGASFAGSRLEEIIFTHCDFSQTGWEWVVLERVKFRECRMEGINWEGTDLSRTVMSPDMLTTLDFSTASAPPRNIGSVAKETGQEGEEEEDQPAEPDSEPPEEG